MLPEKEVNQSLYSIQRILPAWPGEWCDAVGDMLCAVDGAGRVTRGNAVWDACVAGDAPAQALPMFLNLISPKDRAVAAAALARSSSSRGESFTAHLADRHVRWQVLRSGEAGGERWLVGRDIAQEDSVRLELTATRDQLDDAGQALGDAYQKLTFYMMNSPLAFVEWDQDLTVRYWSPEAERAFGWTADEVVDCPVSELKFLQEGSAEEFVRIISDLMGDTGDRSTALSRHSRPDGSIVLCEWYHAVLRDADGHAVSVFSLALDVTERKRAESELLQIRKAVESASDAICISDMAGAIIHINRSFSELTGYTLPRIGAIGFEALVADEAQREDILRTVASEHSWRGELELKDSSNELVPVVMRVDTIWDEADQPVGSIAVCTDLRERMRAERELFHQANHDGLTGLLNRSSFNRRIDRIFTARAGERGQVACLFIDLDNFKVINDSLGHEAGDELLKVVADRLIASVRPEDVVARLGGDEFVILVEQVADSSQAVNMAERILEQLRKPVSISRRELFITPSIGIALNRDEHVKAEDLLRDADVAMYQAKAGGKAGFTLFDSRMNDEAMDRLELEMDLRRAIERDELEVYLQPIMHLESTRLTDVEALLRWHHPTRGLIGPTVFIPIAEESGLIIQLGEWVLEQACLLGVSWNERYSNLPPVTVSVNLSTRQLNQDNVVNVVENTLIKTGLSATQLKLEITESVMLLDSESMLYKLHALRALGVRLAVDDFGTGYSSMAYLSSLPIDTLKIDRAFISRLGTTEDDAIVRAIMTMAKTMGLLVTAEGIELDSQLGELRALGCDRGQGYLFAKPLTITDFEKLLDAESQRERNSAEEASLRPAA